VFRFVCWLICKHNMFSFSLWIPAFVGMTLTIILWIPAFAGMTLTIILWIPAFAGMTHSFFHTQHWRGTYSSSSLNSSIHGNYILFCHTHHSFLSYLTPLSCHSQRHFPVIHSGFIFSISSSFHLLLTQKLSFLSFAKSIKALVISSNLLYFTTF